jgi:hypothetical protein
MREAMNGCNPYTRFGQLYGLLKMTYVENGKLSQNGVQLFIEGILSELDLSHIKAPYSTDFEVFVNDLSTVNTIPPRKTITLAVGVFRCVLERTMSKKSVLVGTGAIALSPLVAIIINLYLAQLKSGQKIPATTGVEG